MHWLRLYAYACAMRALCHTPNNYNNVTGKQAGGKAWPPATISWYRCGIAHDIVIQKITTIQALDHRRQVTCPSKSIAVSTTFFHWCQSCAHCHTEWRPILHWQMSSSTVQSQVRLGRPVRRCHSAGGQLMAVQRACGWFWDGSAQQMWPNKRSRLAFIGEVTGGWLVGSVPYFIIDRMGYIWNLRMQRRHYWSNASRHHEVMHHVSAPYRRIGRM